MSECIFCAIASGKVPSFKIYEDSDFFACLDINPATPGHVLLFPKKHYKSIMELSDEEMKDLAFLVRGISLALVEFGAEGVDVFYPMGAAAGQKIDHMLIHLIPRYKDDGVNFSWNPRKISEEDMKKIQGKILSFVSQMHRKKEPEKIKPIEKVEDTILPRHGGYGL